MDSAVRTYVEAIDPAHRPLFDRVHRLLLDGHPDAQMTISYSMPTFVVGEKRLYVGAWKHGLSFYGWEAGRDAGFAERHPDLVGSKGTIKLSPEAAATIDDDELRTFLRASLTA